MANAEKFVERFTEVWRSPQPQEFADLWTEDGLLLHPGMDEPIGRSEIIDYVKRIKSVAPDISLRPIRWAGVEDYVLIEWTITATFNGERVSWNGTDRFTLRGDRASEGVAYFDSLPLWERIDPTMKRGSALETAVSTGTASA
jgi:uncharacterized protein (TIGR02246 family)